ncbi:MAG: cation diffusion facilitator family transporter [Bacteroidota bacterium]|nr:cation diffusion facilitator family transporter [Bacteroidota bacterium]
MGHNHDHHHHHHDGIDLNNAFKIGIGLNIIFTIIEVAYGYMANSMALVADAGHNFSDVLALAFSWIGVIISQRKPTLRFTYGFRRSTILIAMLNTVLLLVAMGFILWETIHRLGKPLAIKSEDVITIAAIGIVINGFTAWLFVKGKKSDLNIRSAFVHFVADALVSLGVVIAGVLMLLTGITWIDSVVSFIIIVVILYSTIHLLIDSINLGLDAVPEHIDIEAVRTYLVNLPEVSTIHDLHIWALSTTDAALTVHLNTNTQTDNSFIYQVQHELHGRFHIEHATIQIEQGDENCRNNCN